MHRDEGWKATRAPVNRMIPGETVNGTWESAGRKRWAGVEVLGGEGRRNDESSPRVARSCSYQAERVGFEPTIPKGIRALQARALDRTMRPLPDGGIIPLPNLATKTVTGGDRMTAQAWRLSFFARR